MEGIQKITREFDRWKEHMLTISLGSVLLAAGAAGLTNDSSQPGAPQMIFYKGLV